MESRNLSGNTGRVLFLSHNRDRRKEMENMRKFKRGPPKGKSSKQSINQSILSRKGNKYYEE